MELLFPKAAISCLRQVKSEIQTQEETQELRMPEEYPDIGKILGAWGQVLLRGKEWRDGSMAVSGGVMTWVLYQPEGENGQPQIVEAWIPFQMKWDLPQTQRDGVIRVVPLLRSVDARTTSARKMVARVTVSLLADAHVQDETQICTPPELPEDIQLLRHTYPMLLPREAGEKAFDLDEELTLPSSCPKMERIVRFSLQPELIDQKVMSGKLVFRGAAILHLLYMSETSQLCSWDFEIPFSRYAELDDVYEQEARASVVPVLTSLELQEDAEGKLRLKAGLTGQYMVYDITMAEIGQDAYSTGRTVELKQQMLELPVVLESRMNTVTADQPVELSGARIVDVAFYPDHPRAQRNGDIVKFFLSGQFHILSYDNEQLSGTAHRWNGAYELQAPQDIRADVVVLPSGTPQLASGEQALRADVLMEVVTSTSQGIPMIVALDAGAMQEPDASRPGLILRKTRGDTLWEIAKMSGSTVEAIQTANRLEGEPDAERMLLIPVM